MSEQCKFLHEELERLPLIRFPFDIHALPKNGIYFVYEQGEHWGHGGDHSRVVRIGTHKDGNFHARIGEHFLLDESKMNFDATRPAPRERSIFRKHIGRAMLNRDQDPYLSTWEIDFTSRASRDRYGSLRDVVKEKQVETEITRLLRESFSIRFIVMDRQAERMGASGLERRLIGTVAQCGQCRPSSTWLGHSSPKLQIRSSGLWLIQHLAAPILQAADCQALTEAVASTREWIDKQHSMTKPRRD